MKLLAINAGSAVSGAEKVLMDLLAYALHDGVTVTVASPRGDIVGRFPDGAAHLRIPHQIPNAAPGAGRVRRRFLTAMIPATWLVTAARLIGPVRRADVVLVNTTFALPAVALAARCSRRRVVWLVHDTLSDAKQKVAARIGATVVDTAVAVSDTTAEAIRPRYRHVVVRPNGVELPGPEFFAGKRRVLSRPGRRPVVGMLAAITHWKAQDVVIRAIAHLRSEGMDVDAELAGAVFPGSEDYERELRELVTQLGVSDHVRFLGHTPREEAFSRWDVLVSASRRPEAGPLGVLEALAHEVPVIATGIGGSVDYLREGRGVLVPPDDPAAVAEAIRALLTSPEAAERLAETGARAVREEHDISKTIPAMWGAIRGEEF